MTQMPTIGSLFSGYGGLDLAVEQVLGAHTVWVSDIEPGPCAVLARHWPDAPNLGDITAVDWDTVPPVDIITGGSPCQDLSLAGRMAGMTEGTRSNLWVQMREAVRILQPSLVVWENVRGATSAVAASALEPCPGCVGDPITQPVLRALGRVLGDLADLGFDAEWVGLPASAVGAPHERWREFVVAADADGKARIRERLAAAGQATGGGAFAGPAGCDRAPVSLLPTPTVARRDNRSASPGAALRPSLNDIGRLLPTPRATRGGSNTETVALFPTPTVQDGSNTGGPSQHTRHTPPLNAVVQLLPTPRTSDGDHGGPNQHGSAGDLALPSAAQDFGKYALAVRRWESIVGPAPSPTKPGARYGRPRLNPAFAEWAMGLEPGWITDTPGVSDSQALRMAGGGVVPQQAAEAIRLGAARLAADTPEVAA